MLFLGYRLTDLEFRVLLRSLKRPLKLNPRRHISAQVVGDEPASDAELARLAKVQNYLSGYCKSFQITTYWGTTRQFLLELKQRWTAFSKMPAEAEPYVGPRFRREDQSIFFGRSREANEPFSLVISHSEVLLYAQSGAGKTSLINAKLEPLLEGEEFEVLPVARMRTGVAGWEQLAIANVYVFHTLVSWAGDSLPAQALARMTMPEFLKQREQATEEEELGNPLSRSSTSLRSLHLYPEHWKHRNNFFEQLRDTLNACPQLRVLFSMREDYIASIDPYSKILPEALRVRFHLENLRQDAALKAVTGPLTLGYGRRFAPGVAEKLVENLMTVELETATGGTESIISEFVEPLQLQVVCQRLWRTYAPNKPRLRLNTSRLRRTSRKRC